MGKRKSKGLSENERLALNMVNRQGYAIGSDIRHTLGLRSRLVIKRLLRLGLVGGNEFFVTRL